MRCLHSMQWKKMYEYFVVFSQKHQVCNEVTNWKVIAFPASFSVFFFKILYKTTHLYRARNFYPPTENQHTLSIRGDKMNYAVHISQFVIFTFVLKRAAAHKY